MNNFFISCVIIIIAAVILTITIAVNTVYVVKKKINITGVITMFVSLLMCFFSYFTLEIPRPQIYPIDGKLEKNDLVRIDPTQKMVKTYYTVGSKMDPENDGIIYNAPFKVDDGVTVSAKNCFLGKWSEMSNVVINGGAMDGLNINFDKPIIVSGADYSAGTVIPIDEHAERNDEKIPQLNSSDIALIGEGINVMFEFNRKLTDDEVKSIQFSVGMSNITSGEPGIGDGVVFLNDGMADGGLTLLFNALEPPLDGNKYNIDFELIIGGKRYSDKTEFTYHSH